MRIPNSFVLEKNYEQNIEELLKTPKEKENSFALQELLEICQEFTEKANARGWWDEMYDLGARLASYIDYNKSDLEKLSQETMLQNHPPILGLYFSALVNKIITEKDTITLTANHRFYCLGAYLLKGTLIIQGNTGHSTGYKMQGGKITVKGNAEDNTGYKMQGGKITIEENTNLYTGNYMKGGKLVVEGNTERDIGYKMQGGKITVKGKIKSISNFFKKGIIMQGNKTLRPIKK